MIQLMEHSFGLQKNKTTRFDVNQYINPQSFFSIIHVSTNKTFFPLKHLSHWLNCQCIFQYKSIWNFRN